MKIGHILLVLCFLTTVLISVDDAEARKKKGKKKRHRKPAEMVIKQPEKVVEPAPVKAPPKPLTTEETKPKKQEFKEPFANKKWSEIDVKRMCANGNNYGPKSYDSCVFRNMRRVGRLKTPFDRSLINR